MPTYRCPVLVWRCGGGPFTASRDEQHDRAAVATTPRDALDQLRSLLDWQYREEPWRDPPDLKDPELTTFKPMFDKANRLPEKLYTQSKKVSSE